MILGEKYKMKKKQFSIFCIFIVGFIVVFVLFYPYQNKKEPVLQMNFDQKSYSEGDFICYDIEVENRGNQSVYYQYDSFSIEITSDQGFHAIGNGEGNFHQYELAVGGIIAKDMTGYNRYSYMLATGVKDFSTFVKVDETAEPEVARLYTNWSTGLILPPRKYEFHAEFLYYLDKKCESEPLVAECTKKVEVHAGKSEPLEKEVVIEDRIVFYVRTDKTVYKTGETLRTWGKYDWLEGGWFPWDYYYHTMPLAIYLINLDTEEEIELYSADHILTKSLNPETYRGAFYLEPDTVYVCEAGNYMIRYHYGYYMEAGGELNWETVDLPITVVENESKKEFYTNPPYPIPPVQQIK